MAGFIMAQRARHAETADQADSASQADQSDKVVADKFEAGSDILGDGLDGMLVKDGGEEIQVKIGEGASGGRTSIDENGRVQELEDEFDSVIDGQRYQSNILVDQGFTTGYSEQFQGDYRGSLAINIPIWAQLWTGVSVTIPPNSYLILIINSISAQDALGSAVAAISTVEGINPTGPYAYFEDSEGSTYKAIWNSTDNPESYTLDAYGSTASILYAGSPSDDYYIMGDFTWQMVLYTDDPTRI